MMNGHIISSADSLRGFGLSRLGTESCNGSDEKLYGSCSSSSEATSYFDVEPYFGDMNFRCSPRECSPGRIHIVQPRHSPLKDRYITKAADLVSNLKIRQQKQEEEKPKKADCEEFLLLYDDGDEERSSKDETKLRRASSLKSPGSPPHPGEKKIVRFADVLGLDLADVRTFLDEIPKVPRSAFKDLDGVEIAPSPPVGSPFRELPPRQEKSVVPLFQQPFTCRDFTDRLTRNSVCLESASVTDPCLFIITGVVRVLNLGFTKEVVIRHSDDGWSTHRDLTARYVPNSCDGFSDKFSFTLYAHSLEIGDRLEFAIKFTVNNKEFWDNNGDANYSFQCVPQGPSKPITSAYASSSFIFDTWSSFY